MQHGAPRGRGICRQAEIAAARLNRGWRQSRPPLRPLLPRRQDPRRRAGHGGGVLVPRCRPPSGRHDGAAGACSVGQRRRVGRLRGGGGSGGGGGGGGGRRRRRWERDSGDGSRRQVAGSHSRWRRCQRLAKAELSSRQRCGITAPARGGDGTRAAEAEVVARMQLVSEAMAAEEQAREAACARKDLARATAS